MKSYAIAVFSIILILLIGIMVALIPVFTISYGGYYGYNSYASYSFFGIIMFIIIFIIICLVALFSLYIRFILRLGTAARHVNNEHLLKSYRYLMAGIIWGIIGVITAIGLIIFLFLSGVFTSSVDYNNPIYLYESVKPLQVTTYDSAISSIIIISVILIIISLIPLILEIMAVIALSNWADQYALTISNSSHARSIKEGANLVKWGYIASVLIGTIGNIVHLLGFIQMGNALEKEFQSGPIEQPYQPIIYGNNTSQPSNFTIPLNNMSASPSIGYLPPQTPPSSQGKVILPQKTDHHLFCMYCGATFIEPDIQFCPQCGKEQI